MPILVLDRRLQSCTDLELRRLAFELLDAWKHHGRPHWDDMPAKHLKRFNALRDELARRGVQLQLFD